ncbi:MAG: hypothetical protein JRH20_23150, partial [Deltaproteobacteria bacterium]|nr:hypothetical protein [Deltaproteobacteria bacterium]
MKMHHASRLVWLLLFVGCGSRVPQQDGALAADQRSPDSSVDAWITTDTRPPVDVQANCAPPLRWGFTTTALDDADDDYESTFEATGKLGYWGPMTEPLASSPEFRREVRLVDDYSGQTILTLHYYLPEGVELPLVEGEVYTFTIRSRWMWEGRALALLISKPDRVPWPLIFIGEPALVGQALDLDDALMAPVSIERVAGPACAITATICGEGASVDSLRFQFSTGAGVVETELAPGESSALQVFGKDYAVTNLASHHIETP